jgi:hypothetical protein
MSSVMDLGFLSNPDFEALVAAILPRLDVHLFIEGIFVAVICYLLFQKSYKPNRSGDRLTEKVAPHPLPLASHFVQSIMEQTVCNTSSSRVFSQAKKPRPQEVDELCESWQPEPLASSAMADLAIPREEKVISAQGGSTVVLGGVEHVNFSCLDFLSFLGEGRVHDACEATIRKYGVGSCGPRCANLCDWDGPCASSAPQIITSLSPVSFQRTHTLSLSFKHHPITKKKQKKNTHAKRSF